MCPEQHRSQCQILCTEHKHAQPHVYSLSLSHTHTHMHTHTHHTCQPKQFTRVIYCFFSLIILGDMAILGNGYRENIVYMRFCCCFKLSEKIEKLSNEQPIHAIAKCTLSDWQRGQEISSEMRFEVAHVYFAQHCFFLPPPHVPVGIQNATATSEKTPRPT